MRYRTYQIVLAVSQLTSPELEPRGSMTIHDISKNHLPASLPDHASAGALINTAAA
jgi:hypothetical protein